MSLENGDRRRAPLASRFLFTTGQVVSIVLFVAAMLGAYYSARQASADDIADVKTGVAREAIRNDGQDSRLAVQDRKLEIIDGKIDKLLDRSGLDSIGIQAALEKALDAKK